MPPAALSHFQDQELLIEYASLRQPNHAPTGLYVAISPESSRVWHGLLFLHSGPYRGAVFKFSIGLEGYPFVAPSVIFESDVWHPLISRRGNFSTRSRFPTWQSGVDTVSHLLFYLKSAFKESALSELNRNDCINQECFDTYHKSKELWCELAQQCANVSASRSVLYSGEHESGRAIRCIENEELTYDQMIHGVRRYLEAQQLV